MIPKSLKNIISVTKVYCNIK